MLIDNRPIPQVREPRTRIPYAVLCLPLDLVYKKIVHDAGYNLHWCE